MPLAKPLPLGLCVNVAPPGQCGKCWYCLMRAAGLSVGDVLLDIPAVEATVRRGALGGPRKP